MYQVELVWNREFDWVPFGKPKKTLKEAGAYAEALKGMGDGARVKKTRVVDENGTVVWAYGKPVKAPSKG